MQFNDVATEQGIIQEIDFLVNSDSVKFPIADKTRLVNRWYETVVNWILQADGRWQFDDENYTTLPIATTNIVSGQQDYTYAVRFLRITRMEVADTNGTFRWLQPFDQNDARHRSLTEFGNQDGVPCYYDKLANSVFLYPRPNYNATAGLKAYYERSVELFLATDTTKEPGFASIYHKALALGPAIEYGYANGLDSRKIKAMQDELNAIQNDIKEFYSKKSKDEQVNLGIGRGCRVGMWR